MEDENARMAAMEAKFEEEIAQLREANETMREAAAEREATAMGTGAAAAARQGPGGQGVSSVNDSLMRLHYSTRSPPKMPNDPAKTLSWIRRFEMFLVSENLKHILTTIPSTGPVDVISCNDRFFLERIHGVQTVRDNWKVWQHLLEATCNTDIEEKLAACNSVYEAWGVVTEWTLPASEAEKTLLSQQLENVKMYSDEDPKTFFIRVDKLVNMMRRVGITKTESQIVRIIVRQLSDEYTVQRAIIDANPAEYPRVRVEQLIRNAFANRKVKAVMQSNVPSPAAQRDPHALAFGGFHQDRGGGGGGQRSGSGGFAGNGGRQQQRQWAQGNSQIQQQRSSGLWQQQRPYQQGRQQRQQQQQQQPLQQTYQQGRPQQQQQQFRPQRRPPHNPPPGHPTWGPGGQFDCGSNAAYFQKESPPPAGAPMGGVHVCPRCGRYGHTLDICVAPPRFEGNCATCGQYGHMRRHCFTVTRASRPQQHANVVFGGGAFSGDSCDGDIVSNGAVGGVDRRGDGTTSDDTWVQQEDGAIYGFGGTVYGSGGNGGYGMSAPPSQSYHQQDASTIFPWVSNDGAEFGGMGDSNGDEEKDAGDAGGGGLLSCTFGGATRGDRMGPDRHCFTLQFNTALPLRHLSSLFPHAPPGSSIWVGDSGSSVHGTGSDQFVYNKRLARPEETYLHIGNGHRLKVEWFGSLDVVLHCKEDVPVTLEDVAVVPSLAFDLMSINRIQERYDVLMNRKGAWLLNGRVHFVKSPTGNYIAATRVKHRSADPPAMVAALMRPGPQRTGVRGYCDGCGESKAIRRAVPKETTLKAERPMKRVFVDLAGPFLTSAGGTWYCMLMVDDYTNVGWTLFLGDKSGDTLCQAFRSWHTAVKRTAAIHGGLEIARFDNGNEFTNADFRKLLTELGVAVEYTPVDGAKRNGRVERKLALIAEGARAAWLEFPRHFPDLEFPAKANSWHQIWPEAFTWMNDCLNTTAQAHTPDKLSPYERLYKKRPNNRLLPFMMPGFRHHNRKNKAESKGERCFFLNSGNNHSSTTDKILLPSGIASYSADVTWGYRRRPFVGELPTWGGGAVVDLSVEPAVAGSIGGSVFPAASAGMMAGAPAAAGTRGAASAPAVAGSIGGSVFPAASAGMMTGAPAAAGTREAASAPAVAGSIGGSVFPAASAGMMTGAPAAAGTREAASAPAVAGSIGGSVFPAASAGMMAGAPAAVGTRGAASAPAVAGSIGGSVFPAASAGMMTGAPAAAGTREAASAPAVAGSIGGSVFPAASAGMMTGAPAAAGTREAASAPAVAGSIGGSVFPAASAGMMTGAPAAAGTREAASAPAVAGSIGGSVFPAASAGMMAGAPAAAGTRGAASAPAVAGSIGGSVFPAASAGMMTGAPAAAGTRGAASAPAVAGSIGGSVFPAASAGMMAGAPATAGTRGAASAPAVAGSIGGSVFPAASAGMMAGAPAAAGTRGAASAPAVAGSIGGSVFPAASAGMMAGAPAAAGTRGAASAPAVAGSIGGSVFPAASAGMMAGAPTAAGTRGATTSAPVVASGSGGNVFPAESAEMMAGTPAAAGWNGAAFQAASSAVRPLPAVALASDDHEDWQVRRTATATRRQAYEVTPAMTRSGSRSSSRQDGVSGAFAALTMGEETVRTLDKDDGELPAGPAHLLVTPETYAQAHAGPYSRIWTKAESKEFEGLLAVGTFVEEGGI